MKLRIVKKTQKSFSGQDGEQRDYYWYTAERADGYVIRFGSTRGDHKEGDEVDLFIEEYEQSNGRKGMKEIQ